MIKTKKDLKYYLERDAVALYCDLKKRPKLFSDEIWKFQISLRKLEYYTNHYQNKKYFHMGFWKNKIRFKKLSLKLGFSIPINVFEEGLSIAHYGTIVVSSNSKIGKNCRIHEGVTIGATNGSDKAPILGDNVFIGSGAKLIGDIIIADDVAIGANAVVARSIEEGSATYAGVPAKKINQNNSHSNLASRLFA